ncbi:hypothetical protein [Streptomyces sp. NPDC048636]|uniref:hypothetical protein n=1 Tax=Streptomyces sp. NPDC048636 TaxID=3155762 RepID=UPI00342A1329
MASALKVRRATIVSWESGRTEPRPPQREAYARMLSRLAELYPTPPAQPSPAERPSEPRPEAARATEAPPAPAGETTGPPPPRTAPPRGPATRRPDAAKTPAPAAKTTAPAAKPPAPPARTTAPRAAQTATDSPFVNGPLAVVDGDGSAYCVGGLVLDCPLKDIASLVDWALDEAGLGAPRLHRNGSDADPLLVLTAAACERLGLPPALEDRRGLRLPEDHTVVKRLTRAK